jgi:hypothetical protein
MTLFTNQFAVANWVIVPIGQPPVRPEDQQWLLTLSGVALFTFQGLTNTDWRRDSLRLHINLTGAIQATGRSAAPGRELKFQVEQCAPFATLSSIFDQAQSVNAGYAVDAFRPTFITRDTFAQIFDTLEVDLAVRDNDAFILRVGYQITLVGRIVEVEQLVVTPDIRDLERADAEATIQSAGLVVGTVRTLPNPPHSVPPPIVVRQAPAAGTAVRRGTRVNFDLRQERFDPSARP